MKEKSTEYSNIKIDWEKIKDQLAQAERKTITQNLTFDEKRIVLKKRALLLAEESLSSEVVYDTIEVLGFMIGTESYGIELNYVNKVHSLKNLTPLPGLPTYVIGIVNIRGNILPVIDMKNIFEIPKLANAESGKVIVLDVNEGSLGILADELTGLHTIQANEIQLALPTLTGKRAEYLKGITSTQMVILDAQKLASENMSSIN